MNTVTTTYERKAIKFVADTFVRNVAAQYQHNNDIRYKGLSNVGVLN